MEDFDLNMDNELGTSIVKLRENRESRGDSDIDYDKIIENLNSTDLRTDQPININKENPKKNLNINQLARNLETELENFSNNQPQPMNMTKNMLKNMEPPKTNNLNSIKIKEKFTETKQESNVLSKEYLFDLLYSNRELLIIMVIFMILNNKIIIEFIYDKAPLVKNYDSPYPNLIIRTLLFGLIVYLSKKYLLK
jgi:hypothetical protein